MLFRSDVGVAGLGRLLSRLEDLRAAECVVVVAGMDGALQSVIAGLVSAPVATSDNVVYITTRKLADLFARMMNVPVTDATGLEGVFSFTLDWTPDETQRLAAPDEAAATNQSGPSIFAALQEQLGLKLEGKKAPAEVLVVDSIERTPTGN